MPKPKKPHDTATAFQFINSTSQGPSDPEARKRIRSHVMQGKNRRRPRPAMPSWMSGDYGRHLPVDASEPAGTALSAPRTVGTDLSLTIFPDRMEPYMVKDIVDFLNVVKKALYPFEVILAPDKREQFWFNNLMIDSAYLHAVIFSTEAYYATLRGSSSSHLAVKHMLKSLNIVAERIASGDRDATSDTTISAVISLTMAAFFYGDYEAGEMHMEGLYKIIMLRGGLASLRGDAYGIQSKACRVDLGHALSTGRKPLFFADGISWDSYIATHAPIANFDPPPPRGDVVEVVNFVEKLDWRLVNIWRDLHEFAQLGNLAYQTQRQLQHDAFHEMMASIHYRLLHLLFSDSAADEAVRLGMLAFAATVFLQWVGVRLQYQRLRESLEAALRRLKNEVDDVPPWLVVWLIASGSVSVFQEVEGTWLQQWLDDTLKRVGVRSWGQARETLRGVMWIDLLHDRPGRAIFEDAMTRLASDAAVTSVARKA
ncbi:Fungal specific transcription factor domain-containing protein [Pleurostoma richardsiae]|uniref:Fungal specific transcription factor domain-containing protein n=1 Tax=Pleurostoma richardsiae TaxID=41990 RepID=A0AA38RWI7_9PEZI|nr:Fungal specific transcription factor domain-containing protein [Pleurostoma richardsiae]